MGCYDIYCFICGNPCFYNMDKNKIWRLFIKNPTTKTITTTNKKLIAAINKIPQIAQDNTNPIFVLNFDGKNTATIMGANNIIENITKI